MPRAAVNGIHIFYEVHGTGEPLILIAGVGADHRSWFCQLGAFGKYYRVITLDGRGIGKTDRPPGLYTFKTLADDVVGLMNHLDIEKAHLLGESLGGIIAQEIAIAFPHRVDKLILASSTVGIGVEHEVHPDLMKAFGYQGGSTGTDFDSSKVDVGKTMRAMISLSFDSRIYRVAMILMASLYVRPSAFKGMAEQIKAISTYSTLDRLHLIKSPTLVITGTRDRIIPPGISDLLASRISNARLVKIDRGSHAVRVEMRKRFNREVLGFLASAQPGQR